MKTCNRKSDDRLLSVHMIDDQKTIMLLGGSAQQVIAIETAKRLGYRTVVCDYLPDNPGQHHADTFYLESTTDKETMLRIAREEEIDGILAYASDPAAPTAAYVAQELGLPGNPYDSVEILCHKDRFRAFLKENSFTVPSAQAFTERADAVDYLKKADFPVIVKPVDSSGSKGVMVVDHAGQAEKAVEAAFSFSREGRIIVEDYVIASDDLFIGGDIIIAEGKVIVWGLMKSVRDDKVNRLVPVGEAYPAPLTPDQEMNIHRELERMVNLLDIQYGSMNVEVAVNSREEVYLIDIGPRSGGNMIPELMGKIFSIDAASLNIRAAMGERIDDEIQEGQGAWTEYVLHTDRDGVYGGLFISEDIRPYVDECFVYAQNGEPVYAFDNASKAVGIVFLKFENKEQMARFLNEIGEHIQVITGR